jgi:ribosomal protein L5
MQHNNFKIRSQTNIESNITVNQRNELYSLIIELQAVQTVNRGLPNNSLSKKGNRKITWKEIK